MVVLENLEAWITSLAEVLPLEIYVFSGAFIEEVIAPIPSPIIMTLAGTLAAANNTSYFYLLVLALLGAVGKTLASVIVYFIGDKAEDLIIGRWGKYIGVTEKELERIGGQFNGNNRDTIILLLARAIPIVPTAPVSIACGIIKLNMRSYLIGTGVGTFIRNVLYLLLGYLGLASLESLNQGLDSLESVAQIGLAAIGGALILFLYYKRGKHTNLLKTVKGWFGVK